MILEDSAVADQASLVQGQRRSLDPRWCEAVGNPHAESSQRLPQLPVEIQDAPSSHMLRQETPKYPLGRRHPPGRGKLMVCLVSSPRWRASTPNASEKTPRRTSLLAATETPEDWVLQRHDDFVVTEFRGQGKIALDRFEISTKLAGPLSYPCSRPKSGHASRNSSLAGPLAVVIAKVLQGSDPSLPADAEAVRPVLISLETVSAALRVKEGWPTGSAGARSKPLAVAVSRPSDNLLDDPVLSECRAA